MYNQTGFTNNIFRSTRLVKIKLKKKVKTRSIIWIWRTDLLSVSTSWQIDWHFIFVNENLVRGNEFGVFYRITRKRKILKTYSVHSLWNFVITFQIDPLLMKWLKQTNFYFCLEFHHRVILRSYVQQKWKPSEKSKDLFELFSILGIYSFIQIMLFTTKKK